MSKFCIYSIIFLLFLISCKTISVNQELQTKTNQNIHLGAIGEHKDLVLQHDYNPLAVLKLLKPVKVLVNENSFNSSTFKAFKQAQKNQKSSVNINYSDSLEIKPKFFKIEIANRLAIIKSLNNVENKDVFEYVEHKSNSHIITSISIVFSQDIIEAIHHSDEILLTNTGVSSYALILYKDNIEHRTLQFKEGVIFGYQASNFCWKENQNRKLQIVDIVEENDKCPTKTYVYSKRAKKNINYYKF